MSPISSQSLLMELSEFVARHTGLYFPPERASDLQRGIRSAAAELGFEDSEACIRRLLSGEPTRRQIEILASHFTVGETYFFRDKRAFEALEEHVLPELIRRHRNGEKRLRIWSAACCSGEEPYSLAIAVRRALPDVAGWQVSIIGTDINPRFLRAASDGVYGEWSFRDAPPGFKERYFIKEGDARWRIRPDIRDMVSFSYFNLADDVCPSLLNNTNAVDVIFCRNVLIYFTAEHRERVIRNLGRCLVDGGWLVVAPSEISHVASRDLVLKRFPGAIFYRKQRPSARGTETHVAKTTGDDSLVESLFEAAAAPAPVWTEPPVSEPSPSTEPIVASSAYEQALALWRDGHYAEAAVRLEESAERHEPAMPELLLLARSFANLGRLTKALAACDRAIAHDKMNPESHYLRAGVLQEMGNRHEASAALRKTLYLDPRFVLAHFALGNLARDEGNFAEANRHFDNALALARERNAADVLPESDGLTAGRLAEIIATLRQAGATV